MKYARNNLCSFRSFKLTTFTVILVAFLLVPFADVVADYDLTGKWIEIGGHELIMNLSQTGDVVSGTLNIPICAVNGQVDRSVFNGTIDCGSMGVTNTFTLDIEDSGNKLYGAMFSPTEETYTAKFYREGYRYTAWSEMESGTTKDLLDIWGNSATDVFAVGEDGTILHYDGTTWSTMKSGTRSDLKSVWGSSAADVFAVGTYSFLEKEYNEFDEFEGNIFHYDGSNWYPMDSGTTDHIHDIWGSSGINVFAVGGGGIISHYDGSTWSVMESGTDEPLLDIWGSSGTDVFAVGDENTILHYDGTTWSKMDHPDGDFYGIWGSSANDVFAVGHDFYPGKGPPHRFSIILHYDGSTWSEMDNPQLEYYYELRDVWGSSGNDIFAVGHYSYEEIFHPWASNVILHYNSSSWAEMESGTSAWLYGVWGSSGNNVFAVGEDGTILHYNGPLNILCPTEIIFGEHSEKTEFLRSFRDNVLSQTPVGQEIIRLYYEWSPAIVKAMEKDDAFKEEVKRMVDGVLELM